MADKVICVLLIGNDPRGTLGPDQTGRDIRMGLAPAVLQGKRHSVGLGLIQASVTRTLGGEITWYSDKGAVIELVFEKSVK